MIQTNLEDLRALAQLLKQPKWVLGKEDLASKIALLESAIAEIEECRKGWAVTTRVSCSGTSTSTGWTCPKCDRVYAPYVPECQECNNKVAATRAVIEGIRKEKP